MERIVAGVATLVANPIVGATEDETIPRWSTERLFDAAGEPKQIEWFDAGHRTLPGKAMKAIWQFARPLLELP